jgi:hypothetical protein
VNVIKNIQTTSGGIEIELTSQMSFPVRNEMVKLWIGNQECTTSRHPEDGNRNTLIFTMKPEQFARAAAGERVVVQFGNDASRRWDFGPLDRALLDRVNKP